MSELSDEQRKNIHTDPDAMHWALYYKEHVPDADIETMLGWFANAMMAMRLGRYFIGIDINEKYVREIAEKRVNGVEPLFKQAVAVL